jgi:hypothetical protein
MSVLQPRPSKPDRFGLFRVRSPLLAESFLFLWVLRCFSSPGSPPTVYVFNRGMTLVHNAGFPHSEILGSKPAHGYPRLIAVFHVLLRHLAPRHSPYALSSLTLRDAEKLKIFPSCYSVVKVLLPAGGRSPFPPGGSATELHRPSPDALCTSIVHPPGTKRPGLSPGSMPIPC